MRFFLWAGVFLASVLVATFFVSGCPAFGILFIDLLYVSQLCLAFHGIDLFYVSLLLLPFA